MIHNHDRSGWFGASDTAIIMGNWNTKTFERFWLEKLGVVTNTFTTPAMAAGTHYEHRILDALGIKKRDRQIKIRPLRLRVNLDGEDKNTIYEIKTHSKDFKLSQAYKYQCYVQMYASGKPVKLIAYRLIPEEDYINYFNPIDPDRIKFYDIEQNNEFLKEYISRIKFLSACLQERRFPA